MRIDRTPRFFGFSNLSAWPELTCGAFGRKGGVSRPPYDTLNLSFAVDDNPEHVAANRGLMARAVGWDASRLVSARQVHGRKAVVVTREDVGKGDFPDTDAMVTAEPGVLMLMKFADCVPVVMWDPMRRVVAIAHAGWRGTMLETPAAAVELMAAKFGSVPSDLVAGIGPSIGPCCYEVRREVVEQAVRVFPGVPVLRDGSSGRPHLDLWRANAETLMRAGVPEDNVEVAGLCTRCRNDLFFSHRAAGGLTGRFGAVAGIRE